MSINRIITQTAVLIAGVLFLSQVTGCASMGTYNPATGRNEFIFISTSEEISLGESIHQQLSGQFHIIEEGKDYDRVNRIGRTVAQVSDRKDYQYRFFLIEKDELNAFTVPGGRIYVFTGLLDKLTSDGQIASVLAHEIGHCAARHTVKKYQAALGYQLIGGIVLGQVGEEARQIATMSTNMLMNLVFSAYSRQDEYEADRLGVKYLRLSGYDPWASVETLEKLEEESEGAGAPVVLRSHPYIPDRIRAIKREIESPDGSAGPPA